jgi:hypothetical protein
MPAGCFLELGCLLHGGHTPLEGKEARRIGTKRYSRWQVPSTFGRK